MQVPQSPLNKSTNLHLLGVYGTLKAGMSNYRYLERALFVKEVRVPGIMVSWGSHPAAVLSQHVPGIHAAHEFIYSRSVLLELYEINQGTLEACDRLEGHPDYYVRTMVPVGALGHCWVYNVPWEWILAGDQDLVPDGNWKDGCSTMKVDFGRGDTKPKIILPSPRSLQEDIKDYSEKMAAKQEAEKKKVAMVGGTIYSGPDPWEDDYWPGYSSSPYIQKEIVKVTPSKPVKEA
jgi:gamma-glutamylcyclotransferase (GGCT)/AIG2-like uncharacterized protein YtfP